ncbi:hypothetical protein OAT46_08155, partial [Gammaproteobacteria bacterium]|nr:hypothetical protein [Gammaproteobacteria bacterium]
RIPLKRLPQQRCPRYYQINALFTFIEKVALESDTFALDDVGVWRSRAARAESDFDLCCQSAQYCACD